MAPNTTDAQETLNEQFQKLNLKKLAREQGRYQVWPKVKVSLVSIPKCKWEKQYTK